MYVTHPLHAFTVATSQPEGSANQLSNPILPLSRQPWLCRAVHTVGACLRHPLLNHPASLTDRSLSPPDDTLGELLSNPRGISMGRFPLHR